jgi:hypothetical protein
MRLAILAFATAVAARVAAAEPAKSTTTVVFCAPGYPGTSAEAQGAMDAFAAALAGAAGLPAGSLAANYQETEKGGLARLEKADAAVAMMPLAFFLVHEKDLRLTARLQAVPKGRGALERWTLVAKKGRVKQPADLEGFTITSLAGFAPAFVRGPALGAWGKLPPKVEIVQSGAVLSSLRKVVAGQNVAVLLDGEQAAALATLPFANELETVTTSPELPTAIVATLGNRLPPARWKSLAIGFETVATTPEGTAALEGIRMVRFVPLDEKALAAARQAYAEAAK